MAFDAQKQIRENTLELHEFLNDLKGWERTVKERDKKLKSQSQHEEPSKLPPIRGKAQRMPSSTKQHVSHMQQGKEEITSKLKDQPAGMMGMKKSESQPSTAARHTYDHFQDKWDKFDVEAALREADAEDTIKSTSQKATGKKVQSSSNVNKQTQETSQAASVSSFPQKDQMMGDFGTVDRLSSALGSLDEPFPDAISEKELGNEYFKEKKFVQAIECYSRSIALQPSAITYANRAMALIKIRRYKEAESDCAEAIALDDRYVKAYSRRGTARKELGKFLVAVEDFEFALRLEPENKELKKQYLEARALCEKNAGVKLLEKKVSLPIEEVRTQVISKPDSVNENNLENIVTGGQKLASSPGSGPAIPMKSGIGAIPAMKTVAIETKSDVVSKQLPVKNQEVLASVQAAAARAAASAVAASSQKITAPKTSYEFEAMWKSFSGNRSTQAELLKVMNPSTLPKLFKDSLSPQTLADIIRTLELFFPDDVSVAIEILENLTKVGRFNMTIMCLTSKEKAGLRALWEQVFSGGQISNETRDILSGLRAKYHL